MLCANCDHEQTIHLHYRPGSECSEPGCLCARFAHPKTGAVFNLWGRLVMWIRRG